MAGSVALFYVIGFQSVIYYLSDGSEIIGTCEFKF